MNTAILTYWLFFIGTMSGSAITLLWMTAKYPVQKISCNKFQWGTSVVGFFWNHGESISSQRSSSVSFFFTYSSPSNRVLASTIIMAFVLIISLLLEIFQYYIPGRTSSLFDFIANGLGTFGGIGYYLLESKYSNSEDWISHTTVISYLNLN